MGSKMHTKIDYYRLPHNINKTAIFKIVLLLLFKEKKLKEIRFI